MMQLLKVARTSGAVAAMPTRHQAMARLVLRRNDAGAGAAGPSQQAMMSQQAMVRQQAMMQLSMATSSRLMTSLGSWRP